MTRNYASVLQSLQIKIMQQHGAQISSERKVSVERGKLIV